MLEAFLQLPPMASMRAERGKSSNKYLVAAQCMGASLSQKDHLVGEKEQRGKGAVETLLVGGVEGKAEYPNLSQECEGAFVGVVVAVEVGVGVLVGLEPPSPGSGSESSAYCQQRNKSLPHRAN